MTLGADGNTETTKPHRIFFIFEIPDDQRPADRISAKIALALSGSAQSANVVELQARGA